MNIRLKSACLLVLLTLGIVACSASDETASVAPNNKLTLRSPDGRVSLKLNNLAAAVEYSVSLQHKEVVQSSPLGLELASGLFRSVSLLSVEKYSAKQTWQPQWGQFSQITDAYQGVMLTFADKLQATAQLRLNFRVYDQGVAFRYEIDIGKGQADALVKEFTHFNLAYGLAREPRLYSYVPEHAPKVSALSQTEGVLLTPVRTEVAANKHLAIHEAALLDGSPLNLTASATGLSVHKATPDFFVGTFTTSWRTILVADKPDDFILNTLLVNLSPESVIADTSWIKPGKSYWDWRVRGDVFTNSVGKKQQYNIDFESLKHFIDSAGQQGIDYVMIDANWYGHEHKDSSNPYTEKQGLRIKELIRYANDRDIGFILYLNDKASYHHDLDKLFATYAAWGAKGIKYGFLKAKGQEKVRKTIKIVELAAKHQLLINFHDRPIPPTGLRRTYPNWLSREYIHAQTDSGRSFTPSEFLAMINLNQMAGPLDMSNGFYALNGLHSRRNYVRNPVLSTVAGETARALITFSALVILPDSPEAYNSKSDIFDFLRTMPTTWDGSRVLANQQGQYLAMARRTGADWYVGIANNEEAREVTIETDFLPAGQYRAELFLDGDDADYMGNKESYQLAQQILMAPSKITLRLAKGGGAAIRIKPVNK